MEKKILIAIGGVLLLIMVACAYFLGVYLPEKNEQAKKDRLVHEYYEAKLELYSAENEEFEEYEVDIAFIGDSLTDGYNLAEYYPDYVTANRGIGGETTHGLEDRMQVSLYDLKPKVAVMLIGGNNLDTMMENYEDLLIGMRDNLPETKVILLSLTSMGGSWARKNQLAAYNNVIIKKLAAKYGFAFVDLYTPLFNESTGEIYAEYTSDGAHLTPAGYRVFTDAVTPVIEELLSKE